MWWLIRGEEGMQNTKFQLNISKIIRARDMAFEYMCTFLKS